VETYARPRLDFLDAESLRGGCCSLGLSAPFPVTLGAGACFLPYHAPNLLGEKAREVTGKLDMYIHIYIYTHGKRASGVEPGLSKPT